MKQMSGNSMQDSGSGEGVTGVKALSPVRKDILDAAAKIIVERGYEACTMRAVAAIVNMKAGSLYHHFSSKDQIVEEILNTGIENLYEFIKHVLDGLPEDASFSSKIIAAMTAHISCMIGIQKEYMQVYEYLPPVFKRRSRRMREKYARLWYDMFADGVWHDEVDSNIDLKVLVPYFLGGLNRIPEWLRTTGSSSGDIAALAATVLLRGVGPKANIRRTTAPAREVAK